MINLFSLIVILDFAQTSPIFRGSTSNRRQILSLTFCATVLLLGLTFSSRQSTVDIHEAICARTTLQMHCRCHSAKEATRKLEVRVPRSMIRAKLISLFQLPYKVTLERKLPRISNFLSPARLSMHTQMLHGTTACRTRLFQGAQGKVISRTGCPILICKFRADTLYYTLLTSKL